VSEGRSSPSHERGSARNHLGAVIGPGVLGSRSAERLRGLAAAGYREVEAGIDFLVEYRSQVADAGLVARSAFLPTPAVTGNWALWREFRTSRGQPVFPDSYTLDSVIADAASMPTITNLTVVMFAPGERRTLDDYRRRAADVNAAAERCRSAGLTLAYHNHSYEYEPIGGSVPMELLLREFDPGVRLEVDILWTALGGDDPAAFIRRQGRRVVALHLKDLARNAPPVYTGENREFIDRGGVVPIGDGALDFNAVLAAADAAGVKYRFVEDESAGDRYEGLLRSRAFLERLT
jgi:hypothetical protein